MSLNRRERLIVRPGLWVLFRIHPLGEPKRPWALRIEGCLWWLAGKRDMARICWSHA